MGVLDSIHPENYEMMDVNFDSQVAEVNMEQSSKDNSVSTTERTKKDTGWWQKAMQYADCIENWESLPEFDKLV